MRKEKCPMQRMGRNRGERKHSGLGKESCKNIKCKGGGWSGWAGGHTLGISHFIRLRELFRRGHFVLRGNGKLGKAVQTSVIIRAHQSLP